MISSLHCGWMKCEQLMLSTFSELPLSVVQTFYGVCIGSGDFEPLPNMCLHVMIWIRDKVRKSGRCAVLWSSQYVVCCSQCITPLL